MVTNSGRIQSAMLVMPNSGINCAAVNYLQLMCKYLIWPAAWYGILPTAAAVDTAECILQTMWTQPSGHQHQQKGTMTFTYLCAKRHMQLCDNTHDQHFDFACSGSKGSATHRVVLQPLAHFLAVLSKDEAAADQALEGGLPKQRCRKHHQSIEPAPSLINACTVTTRGGLTARQGKSHVVIVGVTGPQAA